jgi:hypothetical protein
VRTSCLPSSSSMYPASLLLAAASPLLVHAFYDTVPVVSWSSSSSLDTLPASSISGSIFDDILSLNSACQHTAIVVVDHPGLRSSDLRSLPAESGLARAISKSKSSRQYPYSKRDASVNSLDRAQEISSRCSAQFWSVTLDNQPPSLTPSSKHVFHISLPQLDDYEDSRLSAAAKSDVELFNYLDGALSQTSSYLVIFTGSNNGLIKRAEGGSPVFASYAPGNGTLSEGGIFKRYQLFTPGLIISLAIVFFVLVPIMMVGVKALSSIQSPVRLDAPKAFNAQDKKTQ